MNLPGAIALLSGFVNLSELLLVTVAREQHGTEDLTSNALRILQEMSPQLPE